LEQLAQKRENRVFGAPPQNAPAENRRRIWASRSPSKKEDGRLAATRIESRLVARSSRRAGLEETDSPNFAPSRRAETKSGRVRAVLRFRWASSMQCGRNGRPGRQPCFRAAARIGYNRIGGTSA
jgi:hypothetical protein